MPTHIISPTICKTVAILIGLQTIGDTGVYAADDQADLRQQFLKGMEEAATQFDQVSFRVHCTIVSKKISEESSHLDTRRDEEFVIELDKRFAKMMGTRDRVEFEAVSNADYAFRLTRAAGRNDYSLTWIAPRHGATPEEEQLIQQSLADAYAWAFVTYHVRGKLIFDWVHEPHFTIKSLSQSDADDGEFVRVDFDYVPPEPEDNDPRKKPFSGYFVCDPTSHWCVREFGSFYADGNPRMRLIVESVDTSDALPIPTRVIETGYDSDGESVFERTEEIEVLSRAPVKPEEFYLSNYGLPEPNFEQAWYGSWLIYLLGGAACLAAAYAIRRRRRAAA